MLHVVHVKPSIFRAVRFLLSIEQEAYNCLFIAALQFTDGNASHAM